MYVFVIFLCVSAACTCGTEPADSTLEVLEVKMAEYGCYDSQPCELTIDSNEDGRRELAVWQVEGPARPTLNYEYGKTHLPNEGGPNSGPVANYTLYADGSGEFSGFYPGSMPPLQKADPALVEKLKEWEDCERVPFTELPNSSSWDTFFGEDWREIAFVKDWPSTCKTWVEDGEIVVLSP